MEDNKLVNPKLLLSLPATPGPTHNGGAVEIGPDNNVYVTIGDLLGYNNKSSSTRAQNFINGTDPDGRAGILRISQEGEPVGKGILGNTYPLNLYYAYGIRNSYNSLNVFLTRKVGLKQPVEFRENSKIGYELSRLVIKSSTTGFHVPEIKSGSRLLSIMTY